MIGQFYVLDKMQDWFISNLPAARDVLSNFNMLNMLFSSFKDYEKKKYKQTSNIVLRFCLTHFVDGKLGDIKQLTELEKALLMFNVFSWKKERINYLKNRLCDDDYCSSLTPYTELTYAKWLADRLGKDKVEIYPKLLTGKYSDILVKSDVKNVYLEVGNLGRSLPEEKIQRILDAAAKHLGSKLKDSCYFRVEIDTAELLVLDSEGHIDEKASIGRIISEMDRLCLDKIVEFKGLLILDDIAFTVRNKTLLEKMNKFLTPNDRKNLELIDIPPLNRWIDSCKEQISQGSKLIKYISCYRFKYLLVEIHPQSVYPSLASLKERNSFICHVIRHIKDQLGQLQPNSPNIIVVQGFNWIIFGFGEDLQFEPLYFKIKDFLNKEKQECLSGIAMFSADFGKSIFVPNEQAAETSKLSKDEIGKLGMHLKETERNSQKA